MKKRIISWITIIAMMSLILVNGIAFAAGDKIAEARSGVVRVLAFFDRAIYLYDEQRHCLRCRNCRRGNRCIRY